MTKLESLSERLNHSKNGLRETERELSSLETNTKVNGLKGEIKEDPNAGKIIDIKRISSDGYKVYSYIVKDWALTEGIKHQAVKQLKLKNDKGVIITNVNGEPKHGYGKIHKFEKGEKVYVKIPQEHHESENKVIDEMKCKGGEYFGIDISKFNENINLHKFKKRNREKWDSEKKDVRGVSFVYIRASDGVTEDSKVNNHVNKIKQYNNDSTIKSRHEKIAVGFYHRMNGGNSAKANAKTFINIYNKHKDTTGGNNLVPMLDLEGVRIKNNSKKDVRNKALSWLQTVEKETGIIPGIYVTTSIYRNYIGNDKRFNRYLTRIAAYPESNRDTGREKGIAERINHRTGAVNIGKNQPNFIKPTMYQSSQEGTVDGAYVVTTDGKGKYRKKYHDTDMDHTKNITKLFSKNNRSR